jgi:hypothetical protein
MNRQIEDKLFITSAITLELFEVAKLKYGYLDNYGMMHFYDMCVSIAEDIIDKDTEYYKYLENPKHFHENLNTCFDWYCIDKSREMFTDERIKKVAGLN